MKKRLSIAILFLCCASACAERGAPAPASDNSNGSAQGVPAGSPASGAQSGTDRGESALRMDGGAASVEYGRPALKGRDLEQMISPGQEWRMGANEATTLTTDVDLKFGDRLVPKGKYVLKARAEDQQKWLLLIQKEDGPTVSEVPLTFRKSDRSAELLTIELKEKGKGGEFVLHWGNLMLSTDFQKA